MTLERPASLKFDGRQVLGGFGGIYLVNAIVGFVFAASAPVAIILTASARGGLAQPDVESWLFGCFFINGLISLGFCLVYRQPLVFFWTIPGTILVGHALDHLSFAEVIGAYYATGALMFLLGLSGWVRKCMSRLPMPIVMAMVAGVFLQFGLNLVFAVRDGVVIAGPMIAAFLLLSARARFARLLPPMIGALIAGVAAIALSGEFDLHGPLALTGALTGAPTGALSEALTVARPVFHVPAFSWPALVELVLPLAITVLAAQNAQGFAVLETAGHTPPVNAVTAACGLGSLIAASVGTVSTCLTGPVNAIISGAGDRDRHYAAGVVVSLLALLFGIFSPVFTRFMLATPKVFIAALAGLALLKVLERAFVVSFNGAFTLGAVVTFLVTVANVPIFSIGAPFWAIVIGFAVSWMLERDNFRKAAAE